jgi:argininosuccinate lyase
MYMRDHAAQISRLVADLQGVIASRAEEFLETEPVAAMPGRTHMQHAQPIQLSHYLLAHVWPLVRDLERLNDWSKRNDRSPYGSGALAGNTLGLDPELVAEELGFADTEFNSIDATASRDLTSEFSYILTQIGIDISRFAEEIIIFNSQEFGFIKLDDAYSTGSSIMPQKKNPDIAELARGKAGRLIGDLTGLLATFKALPLAYDRDLQEDKEPLFDQVDTLEVLLPAFTGMVATMQFNLKRMRDLAPRGFALATDIAEWLVKQHVPFKVAHELSGHCVQRVEEMQAETDDKTLDLWDLADSDFVQIFEGYVDAETAPKVREILSLDGSLAARNGINGTAPESVRQQLERYKDTAESLTYTRR